MRPRCSAALLVAVTAAGVAGVAAAGAQSATPTRPTFSHPNRITNPWLPLSKTKRVELRGKEGGKAVRSVRTLLTRTEPFKIHGRTVPATIVEDRAYLNGKLHEIALDYYAQSDAGTVYYLGEDVDIYSTKGQVVAHTGAFRYGRDTQTLGIAMPARPRVGTRYTFESVPGVGSEKSRVVSTSARIKVPYGTFTNALKIFSDHKPENEREIKWYVRGVGLLREQAPDGGVSLAEVRR
jgi:hypothetical protein